MIGFSGGSPQSEFMLIVESWKRSLVNTNHNLLIWQMEGSIIYFTG